jgi:hypothetical protein
METNIKLKKLDVTTFDGKREVSCWEMTDNNDRKWRIGKIIQRVGNYEHGYDYADLGWVGETCDDKEPKLSTERHISKLTCANEIASKYGVQQNVVVPRFPKNPTMDYDTLMSKIPDSVKERYSFAYNEKINAIQIMNMQSSMSMTIPIDQIDFIKEDDVTINIWVVEKFALNIFKNVNLINIQVF